MSFPHQIFKAYDIRGLVAGELSSDLAYRIGRAFAVFIKQSGRAQPGQALVVGRDMRSTSPEFAEEVARGITAEGVNVVVIGEASTPLFNFACAHYPEHAGGIMVTASHNPAEYNGFKMTLDNGLPIGKGGGMETIAELVEKNEFIDAPKPGAVSNKIVLPDYLAKVFSIIPKESIAPLRVVIDAANGMAAATFVELVKALPISVEYLYLEPDGRFPNHEANPLKTETLNDLRKKVVETKADMGFALDGDADRIGLVDENGEVVDASFVGALVGLEVLERHPKAHCLYDVRSSQIVSEVWRAKGATAEPCKVGHANIKKQIKEKPGTAFASELSLHLYYHDMYDVESSDLSLLYILHILSREKKPLSELIRPFKKYAHSGEINFEVEDKAEAIARLREKYTSAAKEVSDLDGIWMRFDWGWFNVRASNTEPVLRLNLEARSEELMKEKVAEISGLLR